MLALGAGRLTEARAILDASYDIDRELAQIGAGGQVDWGDPGSGLSFAYLPNRLDRHPIASGRRGAALSNRAGALMTPGG